MRGSSLLVVIATLASSSPAVAASETARALAAGCVGCHQREARSPPPLTGRSAGDTASLVRAFRDGTRPGTVMPQLARGYTDAEIDAIAGYFAEHGAQ